MYEDIFESIRQAAEKRNLREATIQLYCRNISYFLRCVNKPVSDLTLEDADAFLTMKRLEGRSPETHNHYRSSIKFLYKRVLKIRWDDEPAKSGLTGEAGFKAGEDIFNKIYHNYIVSHRKVW